jgi:predicted methyltransferase
LDWRYQPAGRSTMLANKDDPHSIKVFDPSIKGETDRFAYRFVKP